MRSIFEILLTTFIIINFASAGFAGIVLSDPYPKQGSATIITVTNEHGKAIPNLEIWVIYRPNSKVSKSSGNLGSTDNLGRFEWTPSDPGICTIEAKSSDGEIAAADNFAVKFARFPISGLIIFLFAGTLLYGGIIFSFQKLYS